jgi:hypothetical protein
MEFDMHAFRRFAAEASNGDEPPISET